MRSFAVALIPLALAVNGLTVPNFGSRDSLTSSSLESDVTAVTTTTKRGVVYLAIADPPLTNFGSNVTWAVNFQAVPGPPLPSHIEFVPTLDDGQSSTLSAWATNAQNAINSGATHLLGFNEPDQITGSNLQPIEAAELWMQFMQPFAGKAKLCSPQISSASPGNTNWMDQFLQVCSGCTIDCIGFHASSLSQPTVSSLELYAETIINRYNKPLWLSQFDTAQQQTYLRQILPFLDGAAAIERYAFFTSSDLVNSDGTLTQLGEIYNSG